MSELTFTAEYDDHAATLESWGFSVSYAEYDGERNTYDWNVTQDNIVIASSYPNGDRIRSGCCGRYDRPESLSRMLGTLFSFLSVWSEAVEYSDRSDAESENVDLFPVTLLPMLERFSSDELSLFGADVEGDR